jgi:ankyrin repeat protein
MCEKNMKLPSINTGTDITDIIEKTIKGGSNIELKNLLRNNNYLNNRNSLNQTPLMIAIKYNNLEMIETIVDSGANLNLYDNDGNTALIISSKLDKEDIIKLLLDSKADFSIKNKKGYTALEIANRFKNKSSIGALSKNSNIRKEYKFFTQYYE